MLNIVDTGKTNYETPKKSIFWPWPRFLWFLLTITLKRFTCSHQGQLNKIEVRKRVFYRNNKNEWGIIIIIIIIRSSLLGIPWHSPSTFLCLPLQLLVVQFCILCHPSIGQCRSFFGRLLGLCPCVGFQSNAFPAGSCLLKHNKRKFSWFPPAW